MSVNLQASVGTLQTHMYIRCAMLCLQLYQPFAHPDQRDEVALTIGDNNTSFKADHTTFSQRTLRVQLACVALSRTVPVATAHSHPGSSHCGGRKFVATRQKRRNELNISEHSRSIRRRISNLREQTRASQAHSLTSGYASGQFALFRYFPSQARRNSQATYASVS